MARTLPTVYVMAKPVGLSNITGLCGGQGHDAANGEQDQVPAKRARGGCSLPLEPAELTRNDKSIPIPKQQAKPIILCEEK